MTRLSMTRLTVELPGSEHPLVFIMKSREADTFVDALLVIPGTIVTVEKTEEREEEEEV